MLDARSVYVEGRGVVVMVSATSGIWLIIVIRTVRNYGNSMWCMFQCWVVNCDVDKVHVRVYVELERIIYRNEPQESGSPQKRKKTSEVGLPIYYLVLNPLGNRFPTKRNVVIPKPNETNLEFQSVRDG